MVEAPRATVRVLTKELKVDIPIVACHLKQIGKKKNLTDGCHTKKQKNRRFEALSSLLLHNNNDAFSTVFDERWILHNNRRRFAQWVDAVGEARKYFLKLNFIRRRSRLLFGGLQRV